MEGKGILARWNNSGVRAVYISARGWAWWMFKKSRSIAWILGTTLIIVGFPLVLEIEREQQLIDLENQQRQQGFAGSLPYTPVGAQPTTPAPATSTSASASS